MGAWSKICSQGPLLCEEQGWVVDGLGEVQGEEAMVGARKGVDLSSSHTPPPHPQEIQLSLSKQRWAGFQQWEENQDKALYQER